MTAADSAVSPILPSRDLDATEAFYGPLGFSSVARYTPPDAYLILRRFGGPVLAEPPSSGSSESPDDDAAIIRWLDARPAC